MLSAYVKVSLDMPEGPMAPSIPGLKTRFLSEEEASNAGAALDLVVVAEPDGDPSAEALERVFAVNRATFQQILVDHGNVLFRGFEIEPHQFNSIVGAGFSTDRFLWMFPMAPDWARSLLNLPLFGWLTRALLGWIEARATGREIVGEKQSTLAKDPTIQFPHHEYGIFFNVPHVLAFYCERDAEVQGETLLCDAKAGYQAMPRSLRSTFEATKHIRYRSENQWYLPPFTAPAILRHPLDDHPSMNFTAYQHDVFGEIAKARFPDHEITTEDLDATFSFDPLFYFHDGERRALHRDEVASLAEAHLDRSVLLRWEQGDLLLMDNFRVVHGRLNAGMPVKKILQVILCDYVRNTNRFTW